MTDTINWIVKVEPRLGHGAFGWPRVVFRCGCSVCVGPESSRLDWLHYCSDAHCDATNRAMDRVLVRLPSGTVIFAHPREIARLDATLADAPPTYRRNLTT